MVYIIITVIKSYYGTPQPVHRSASQHKLQLRGKGKGAFT